MALEWEMSEDVCIFFFSIFKFISWAAATKLKEKKTQISTNRHQSELQKKKKKIPKNIDTQYICRNIYNILS